MKPFIITLALSIFCNFFAMRRYKSFNGASRRIYNFLEFSSGFGTALVYLICVVSCFLTTWWIPIVAFFVAHIIAIIIPLNFWGEMVCAFLWPLFFVATIILMLI